MQIVEICTQQHTGICPFPFPFPHFVGCDGAEISRIGHWWDAGLGRSRVRSQVEAAVELFSPGSTFYGDSYFGIRSTPVLPQCYRSSKYETPVILRKFQVAGYIQKWI